MRAQPFSPLGLATALDLGPSRNFYAKRKPEQAKLSAPAPQPGKPASINDWQAIYAARRPAHG